MLESVLPSCVLRISRNREPTVMTVRENSIFASYFYSVDDEKFFLLGMASPGVQSSLKPKTHLTLEKNVNI